MKTQHACVPFVPSLSFLLQIPRAIWYLLGALGPPSPPSAGFSWLLVAAPWLWGSFVDQPRGGGSKALHFLGSTDVLALHSPLE